MQIKTYFRVRLIKMNSNYAHVNSLHKWANFSLFVTSYTPLFILISLKQLHNNYQYLHWGGLNNSSFFLYMEKFALTTIFLLVVIFGLLGTKRTLNNINKRAKNGFPVTVVDLKNKNSESVNYIATYIIPFAFQAFSSWFELVSTIAIISVIYRIYVNSSLILVNPLLSFKYGLFEIQFKEGNNLRNGMIISPNKFLTEDEIVQLYPIGHKMYYALKVN